MKRVLIPRKMLSKLLWLVPIHSFMAGIGSINLPDSLMHSLGFSNWFEIISRAQGNLFCFEI